MDLSTRLAPGPHFQLLADLRLICHHPDRPVALAFVAVLSVVALTVIPAFVVTLVPLITMPCLIAWYIFAVIPVVLHKIDTFTAGVVFTAVLFPPLGMSRRYAHIDRSTLHSTLDIHRLPIDELWRRIITNIDLPVKTGLSDAYRYAYVGGNERGRRDD